MMSCERQLGNGMNKVKAIKDVETRIEHLEEFLKTTKLDNRYENSEKYLADLIAVNIAILNGLTGGNFQRRRP
jgi:cell fate (sporulation/competence/biofilm development) regulator YmcA (YheA/YmcA/DUF963 family)